MQRASPRDSRFDFISQSYPALLPPPPIRRQWAPCMGRRLPAVPRCRELQAMCSRARMRCGPPRLPQHLPPTMHRGPSRRPGPPVDPCGMEIPLAWRTTDQLPSPEAGEGHFEERGPRGRPWPASPDWLAQAALELLDMIEKESRDSLFWKFARVVELADDVSAMASKPLLTVPLCRVASWERGEEPRLVSPSTPAAPFMRITRDVRGLPVSNGWIKTSPIIRASGTKNLYFCSSVSSSPLLSGQTLRCVTPCRSPR